MNTDRSRNSAFVLAWLSQRAGARRMYLAALACITTIDLARRYELNALSSAGESGGDSPRLLALLFRPITGTTDYSLGLAALADAISDDADAVRWRR